MKWIPVALALLAAMPAQAQAQDADERYAAEDERPELEDEHEFGPPDPIRGRPWTMAAWVPANWRSNRALSPNDPQAGVAIEPELSLNRRWGSDRIVFFGEAGIYQSTMLPDEQLDLSGWWITAELSLGNPRERWSPYIAYEPRGIYADTFGSHVLTFQDITLGIRRADGPFALNLFARRRESDGRAGDRAQFAAHGQFTQAVGSGLTLNIRADAEYRSFDHVDDERRRDIRGRVRTRLFVPLDPAVDLVLTADVQRHWSTQDRFQFTNVVIGPALSARFGF